MEKLLIVFTFLLTNQIELLRNLEKLSVFLLLSSQISVTLVLDIYRIRLRYLSVVN
ncbi:hypothetical protein HMPREF0662_01389 [Prevotella nigrescens F0103]|nr:hypothetical protein HMPREF0662_01389 [Prevotella nigrescens F0103]